MSDGKIEELATQIADTLFPPRTDDFVLVGNEVIKKLLIQFAAEVKRSALEP